MTDSYAVSDAPRAVAPELDAPLSIVETLTTAVLLFDADLVLLALNPAAEVLLDVSANKVRGSDVSALWPQAELWSPALRRVLETGQSFTERAMLIENRAGEQLTVDCTATPVAEPGRANRLLVEIFHLDPHRRFSREEQRVAQGESARAVLRGLAHEIKNPLGGIRGAAQLLERELDDRFVEYTQIIVREADRLKNLVDRMLGPRTPPRMRPLNVHTVTERVRALIEAEAPPGVTIVRDYDPSIPELEAADPELLIQATLNVARNAVQALEGAGRVCLRTRVHRSLTIGHRRHRLVVGIDVVDSGPGVPTELREQIFYPMVTGRIEGTGLGLSIAQSLVHQHGGLIECDSQPGSTTFSILLPVDGDSAVTQVAS